MRRFLQDTSCLIAALCFWHEQHDRAAGEIDRRLSAGEAMVLAAPSLVETYAVLTRIPPPHRITPAQALALIEANFFGPEVETVGLTPAAYHQLLRDCPTRGTAGGQIYDAVIVACGLAAKVDALVTLNERHFRALAGDRILVVVPN